MAVIHTWVTRTYCTGCSQYLWTNPGSPSVQCSCTETEIQDDIVIRGGQDVTDEDAFKLAVSEDTEIPIDDLRLRIG